MKRCWWCGADPGLVDRLFDQLDRQAARIDELIAQRYGSLKDLEQKLIELERRAQRRAELLRKLNAMLETVLKLADPTIAGYIKYDPAFMELEREIER